MKSTFPRNPQYKETATGQQGHEETRQVSVSEEEEASPDRGTEENRAMSEAGLTVRMDTDCSSSGTFPEEEVDQRNSRRDTDNTVPKVQGNPQKVSLLPSFFVAPICTEIPGSPPYRIIPIKREVMKPVAVAPKKENRSEGMEVYSTLENPKCVPEGMRKLPTRPTCGTQKPRNPKKSKTNAGSRIPGMQRPSTEPPPGPRTPRPSTEPPPGPRTPRPSTEPSPRKSAEHLVVEKAGGRGEVREKLVYVVEEKGKSVTKVETDLFTVNEILTIKKDLLELSEFAKKLKQLKEKNKPQETAKAEDGTCRCEPSAKILKDVNKRIEALEMRQEELEKGRKTIQKEELGVKRVKTPSSTLREPAKPTVNVVAPAQSKVNETVTRRGAPNLSNAADLVNELMDIKEQLKRLEEKRSPKPVLEEMPVEWVYSSELGRTVRRSSALMKDVPSRKISAKKKDGAIAVFSSKTYIFPPDKLGEKGKEERKESENKAFGDKVGFEEARIINWLKGVCSGGSDFKVLLKPSPTIMEESLAEGKVEFTCKNCSGPLEEMGALGNQEPQKNRATQKDLRQDDFLKKESSSRKVLKKRSYKECFVSPSGRFFAWMKRSSDKVMRNFCSEWPQPKILRKVQPKQISRTTSTRSIVSMAKESPPPRGVRCSVLSEISLSGNLQDFVRVVCKSEKTAMNENMKCLGKKGRRSLSKDKLQKEGKNQAVRRREPRWVRPKKNSELSLSSSSSEIMDTMDFDLSSNSVEGSRWQKSNEFHAQVFSCFTQPDCLLDTSHRRTEWYRESDKERRKREKKERKAVKRLQKKTAKLKKSCEKRRSKLAKKEEDYASRCIIEDCDFGKDYWRKYSPVQSVQQPPQATVEASKQIPSDHYRPNVYKKQEYPPYPYNPAKQPYVNGRYGGQNYFEDKKLRQEDMEENDSSRRSSTESVTDPRTRQPERTKSVLSAERPSFERNTLRDFFKSFGWLYPRLGEICGEYQERKKLEHDMRRRRREKDEFPADRFLEHKKYDHDSRTSSNGASSRSSAGENDHPKRNLPHNHDPENVENCDCVRLYLQTQVEKKLAALRNAQLTSTESAPTNNSKFDFEPPKHQGRLPKSGMRNRKETLKREARRPKAEHHKKKDFEYRKHEETVPRPERSDENDLRTYQQGPTVPELPNKMYLTIRKHETRDHPDRGTRNMKHRDGDVEYFCQFCGTTPCLIAEKHDIGKRESSESTQEGVRGGVSSPRKAQGRQPQENPTILSYLCQLWKNKNRQPNSSSAEGRVLSPGRHNSKISLNSPPVRLRCKVKAVCSRCDLKQRNLECRPLRLEKVRSPPSVCIFREECPEPKKIGARPSPRMTNHPPTHAHCFLINENCDNKTSRADLLCFPQDSRPERRCRQRRRVQEEVDVEDKHRRRDQAIECHFIRECQDVTTETEDMSVSGEKISRKNLKARLVSLHCLWKNLRRCTMQKAMMGREVGRSIRRKAVASLSGLDTYDCWWSDTWPKPRRHRHCRRRRMRR